MIYLSEIVNFILIIDTITPMYSLFLFILTSTRDPGKSVYRNISMVRGGGGSRRCEASGAREHGHHLSPGKLEKAGPWCERSGVE
jgi:hypothetical protein